MKKVWFSLVSRVYYGTLIYIRILQGQMFAGTISRDNLKFYKDFISIFPLDDLPVAGPMVAFFMALCVAEDPFQKKNYIVPRLHSFTIANGNNHFLLEEPSRYGFPNMIWLRRGYNRFFNATNAHIWNGNFHDTTANNIGYADNAAEITQQYAPMDPCIINDIWTSNTERRTVRAFTTLPTVPTVLRGANGITTIDEYLGFADSFHWFVNVVKSMTRYTSYFKGSISLGKIPILGAPTMLCPVQYNVAYNNRDHQAQAGYGVFNFKAHMICAIKNFPQQMIQLAMYTQMNAVLHDTYAVQNETSYGGLNDNYGGQAFNWTNAHLTSYSRDVSLTFKQMIFKHCDFKPTLK
jgi:hypothetical protein